MRFTSVASLILLCCTLSLARVGRNKASATPPDSFEQTLTDCEKGFIEAAKKGDTSFFKRTLTDDFSFVQYDGQLYSRQEMIDQFNQPGFDIMPYETKIRGLPPAISTSARFG
jgi:hypothetical protein